MILLVVLVLHGLAIMAQPTVAKLYNPGANAEKQISDAIKKAKTERKNLIIQAGGNWCSWCIEFSRFCKSDVQVDSLLRSDYIVYHLNYSPENKNTSILARYGYPQRFGFPVFLIIDENGNRVHTQDSEYLEQGKSYNRRKVLEFLLNWNRTATNPTAFSK